MNTSTLPLRSRRLGLPWRCVSVDFRWYPDGDDDGAGSCGTRISQVDRRIQLHGEEPSRAALLRIHPTSSEPDRDASLPSSTRTVRILSHPQHRRTSVVVSLLMTRDEILTCDHRSPPTHHLDKAKSCCMTARYFMCRCVPSFLIDEHIPRWSPSRRGRDVRQHKCC